VIGLVGSELLKLRTTRAWIGYVAALVGLTGVAVAAQIQSAATVDLETVEIQRDIYSTASISGLIAFLLGITAVTWEWRHGTITPTFLATPKRERVVVAKVLSASIVGALLLAIALVVVLAVAVPWYSIEGVSLSFDRDVLGQIGRLALATILWGALGAVFGSLVHSQVGALVGSILWLLIGEALATGLLSLVDAERIGDFFPGAALTAVEGSEEDLGLSGGHGLLVALGYLVAIGALGIVRTRRRDVT
jgi:ABC-type transport system involved in multi-copper enzyme maturation permease subunit